MLETFLTNFVALSVSIIIIFSIIGISLYIITIIERPILGVVVGTILIISLISGLNTFFGDSEKESDKIPIGAYCEQPDKDKR